ncbi:PNK3P-domain-containing protein [Metschnikowia bicuspidata]|uniref:PNK3P-domain-containing protein n=1 Tax=Metschnikowia bicuspidata TaxID=27322 RepID=A0A4P9ZJ34_9ASCO|nr:PNK3P-domain-containing protein [Metschnikowia bicuspidata]
MHIIQLLAKKQDDDETPKEKRNVTTTQPPRSRSGKFKVYGSHMISNLPPKLDLVTYLESAKEVKSYKVKIAAFDMDDTIICSKSGFKWGRGPNDWKWRTDTIIPVLQRKTASERYVVVIFTNQKSISVTEYLTTLSKSFRNFAIKVGQILASLNVALKGVPVLVFAASGRPGISQHHRSSEEYHEHSRKPRTGMWEELESYLKAALGKECTIDMEKSFYVGDAAGRHGDHLADDITFAQRVGLPFQTPEEFFGK